MATRPGAKVQNRRCRCSTQRTERSYGQYAIGGRDRELSPRARDIRLTLEVEVIAINCQYQGHHNDQNERERHTVSCEVKCANDEPVQ